MHESLHHISRQSSLKQTMLISKHTWTHTLLIVGWLYMPDEANGRDGQNFALKWQFEVVQFVDDEDLRGRSVLQFPLVIATWTAHYTSYGVFTIIVAWASTTSQFEVACHSLACLSVQNNHPTINCLTCLMTFTTQDTLCSCWVYLS